MSFARGLLNAGVSIVILQRTMSYQDSAEWASGRVGCSCAEEVALLQGKLAQVHSKLIRQIEICQQQQEALMGFAQRGSTHKASYDTFGGRQSISEGYDQVGHCDQSQESYFIKNDLLQADLEAMRRRVLAEITEKNKLLEEMGQLKKKHRRQMGNQVKKFQGLEIVYKQLVADRQSPDTRPKPKTSKAEAEAQRLSEEVQELTVKLHREREKVRKLEKINDTLTDQVRILTVDEKQQGREKENRRRGETNGQDDHLRQIGNLKQQINRLNRNIGLKESQSRQRSSSRAAESHQESGGETKLVGMKGWGRKAYS